MLRAWRSPTISIIIIIIIILYFVCFFAKWTREIVVRVFLWYYVIIELFVKGGRWRARATRPWRPADVSALPRRYAAYGPPLDASAHGRKVLHASRPTRTLAGGIQWRKSFATRRPVDGGARALRRDQGGLIGGERRRCGCRACGTVDGQVVSRGSDSGGQRGLKFRNGFSSSKPPPVAPYTHPPTDNTPRPSYNTHTHERARTRTHTHIHCASETPRPRFPRTQDNFSLSRSAPAIVLYSFLIRHRRRAPTKETVSYICAAHT